MTILRVLLFTCVMAAIATSAKPAQAGFLCDWLFGPRTACYAPACPPPCAPPCSPCAPACNACTTNYAPSFGCGLFGGATQTRYRFGWASTPVTAYNGCGACTTNRYALRRMPVTAYYGAPACGSCGTCNTCAPSYGAAYSSGCSSCGGGGCSSCAGGNSNLIGTTFSPSTYDSGSYGGGAVISSGGAIGSGCSTCGQGASYQNGVSNVLPSYTTPSYGTPTISTPTYAAPSYQAAPGPASTTPSVPADQAPRLTPDEAQGIQQIPNVQNGSASRNMASPQRASATIPQRQTPSAPRIRPVPDLDAHGVEPNAPSLLDPRDRTASAPIRRTAAYTQAGFSQATQDIQVIPATLELSPAMSMPSNVSRVQTTRVSTAKPVASDAEVWDDTLWKSVKP
ncbi:hypothetical protein [Lignipirellula cremea]|uniref:TNFR-Cys domain-containing protein n=1 Tax=Lignipirellula cremea TaxID=2528010 RepID=A0A518DU45_9BACT|nr:hypothetical protein [Lignipirellula cremea]QDU95354.1 hypothetical protein Pla8534_31690 [Lignipirellula cremea]